MKKTTITIYASSFGVKERQLKWYVKILFSFKVYGGVVVFETALPGCHDKGLARKLANRIKQEMEDESIPTVVEVVEKQGLV